MKLNLNVCSQNQFNCNDGTCFTIDFRCDGVGDCVGSEDEETCNIIQFTDSYFNNIPPYMYYGGGIVLSMTVLNVTDVQELSGIVKAHLKVNLEWKDVRFMVESFYFIFADQGTFHIFIICYNVTHLLSIFGVNILSLFLYLRATMTSWLGFRSSIFTQIDCFL